MLLVEHCSTTQPSTSGGMAGIVEQLAEQLSEAHVNLDECTAINYSGKSLKLDKEGDADTLVREIDGCSNMKVLQLNGNTVGPDAAAAIAKAVQKHPELERALWSDMFTGRSKAEIPPALRALGGAVVQAKAKLTELDLSDNAFGPVGVESIVDLLESSSCFSLKCLRLNNNGLGITGGKLLAKTLLRCHARSVEAGTPLALKVFVSGRNRLENEGATALAEAFKSIGTLEEVSMPQNGINHPGIAALADAFSACCDLRIINLSDNTFTLKGAQAMANALPKLPNLELINFESCLVKTEGAKKIAAAIAGGDSKLKELNLQYNEIGIKGALALVDCIKGKAGTLQRIDLNGNSLGENGKECLREALNNIDLLGRLGSLSEDEGSEDEEEDKAGTEEDETEEVENKLTQDHFRDRPERGDTSNGQKVEVVTPEKLLSGTASACVRPSTVDVSLWKQYMAMELKNGDSSDLDVAAAVLNKAMTFVMKLAVALASYSAEDKEKAAACSLCDMIFDVLPMHTLVPSLIANTLVVHLGLLKSEDKKFVPVTENLTGPLILLSHYARQTYFPKAARDIIKICLGQPHKKLDPYASIKHQLMQALYKC